MRDTIEMALEAGFMLRAESVKGQSDWWECFDEEIQKLVTLVREDEREETNRRANASWALMCEKMVAAEREAGAKVCETYDKRQCYNDEDMAVAKECAAAIRARGNT